MIRNPGIVRIYFNKFYTGLILCYKDHINIFFKPAFEKYDRKDNFCISNNQCFARISITIDLQIDNNIKQHAIYHFIITI